MSPGRYFWNAKSREWQSEKLPHPPWHASHELTSELRPEMGLQLHYLVMRYISRRLPGSVSYCDIV